VRACNSPNARSASHPSISRRSASSAELLKSLTGVRGGQSGAVKLCCLCELPQCCPHKAPADHAALLKTTTWKVWKQGVVWNNQTVWLRVRFIGETGLKPFPDAAPLGPTCWLLHVMRALFDPSYAADHLGALIGPDFLSLKHSLQSDHAQPSAIHLPADSGHWQLIICFTRSATRPQWPPGRRD
jgi:hypothetical protein